MKTIFKLILLLTFLSTQAKAQDDPNQGFYVDGVKVTELNCYTFGKLTVVMSNNSGYGNYDRLRIIFRKPKIRFEGIIEKATYSTKHNKGKYFVYDIYVPNEPKMKITNEDPSFGSSYDPTRGFLAAYKGKEENVFTVTLIGETITGYTEEYDASCSCVKKTPNYSKQELEKVVIKCTNEDKKAYERTTMDLSQPCTVSGTKVDFNNLK